MADSTGWIALFGTVLGGGGLKYAFDSFQDFRHRAPAEVRKQLIVDASITTVSKARDELEMDNARLRQTHAEDRANWNTERERYERERAEWAAEKIALKREVDSLEAQIRKERKESAERYDNLLRRITELSARHAPTPRERDEHRTNEWDDAGNGTD